MDLLRATICALCLAICGAHAVAQEAGAASADARVKVTMTNGSIIVGIARGGALCERQVREGFEPAKSTDERGAGIRVWYYQRMNGFLFLPHRLVEEVEIISTLTPEQSAAITQAIVKGPGRAAQKPRSATTARSGTSPEVQGKEASWTPGQKTPPTKSPLPPRRIPARQGLG